MSRMRIEYTDHQGNEAGGYLDAVSHWFRYGGDSNRTVVAFAGGLSLYNSILVNAPVEEVVKILDAARAEERAAAAYGKDPDPLDLKALSGKQPKPSKAPKQGLSSRFKH